MNLLYGLFYDLYMTYLYYHYKITANFKINTISYENNIFVIAI